MSVADYMTPRLVVVSPKTTISVAVELMKKMRFIGYLSWQVIEWSA